MSDQNNNQALDSGSIPVRVVAGSAGGGGGFVGGAPLGYRQITSLSSSTGLPATIPPTAKWAVIQAEGNDIRWRDDGVAPTASVGMILYMGTSMTYAPTTPATNLAAIRFIQVDTGGILNVTYYG